MIDQQVIDELVGNFLFVLLPLIIAGFVESRAEKHNKKPRVVASHPHFMPLN